MYQSRWCPKPDCGSPMDPHYHRGEHKMRCSKRKCQHITRDLVSVYFHQAGTSHIATRPHVRCIHPSPSVHLCTMIVHRRPSQCITLHCRPTGNKEGGATTYRIQTEIAMCFAWGTVPHCTHMCDRCPSQCLGAARCRMCITTHSHVRSPSVILHVCDTVPHVYCCTLAHIATGSASLRCPY